MVYRPPPPPDKKLPVRLWRLGLARKKNYFSHIKEKPVHLKKCSYKEVNLKTKETGRYLKQLTGYKVFHVIESFAMWQQSRRDMFNRTKPDRIMKRTIPVTNPQHQMYTGQECVCLHGGKAGIKMIVHVADAVESFHKSNMI